MFGDLPLGFSEAFRAYTGVPSICTGSKQKAQTIVCELGTQDGCGSVPLAIVSAGKYVRTHCSFEVSACLCSRVK